MKFVLFAGYKIGFTSLQTLIHKVRLELVVIEKEHDHEHVKYYDEIIRLCKDNGIPFYDSREHKLIYDRIAEITPDYIFVFGYRRLIKREIFQLAKKACIACHFSLLPEYRGFAPVNWAVINGERKTGITFFHLDDDVDNGDIVAQREVTIEWDDDVNTVFDKCYASFQETLLSEVANFENGIVKRTPQNAAMATYTCARSPEDGEINWNNGVNAVYNLIRGLTYPFPGAFTYLGGKKVYIWKAKPYDIPKYVGVVVGRVIKIIPGQGVVVLLEDGALLVEEVQVENEEKCTADQLIKSIRLKLG